MELSPYREDAAFREPGPVALRVKARATKILRRITNPKRIPSITVQFGDATCHLLRDAQHDEVGVPSDAASAASNLR
jgi:hypothetical protein